MMSPEAKTFLQQVDEVIHKLAPNLFGYLEKSSLRFPEMFKVYSFSRNLLGIHGKKDVEQHNKDLAKYIADLKHVNIILYYLVTGHIEELLSYIKKVFPKKLALNRHALKKECDCAMREGLIKTIPYRYERHLSDKEKEEFYLFNIYNLMHSLKELELIQRDYYFQQYKLYSDATVQKIKLLDNLINKIEEDPDYLNDPILIDLIQKLKKESALLKNQQKDLEDFLNTNPSTEALESFLNSARESSRHATEVISNAQQALEGTKFKSLGERAKKQAVQLDQLLDKKLKSANDHYFEKAEPFLNQVTFGFEQHKLEVNQHLESMIGLLNKYEPLEREIISNLQEQKRLLNQIKTTDPMFLSDQVIKIQKNITAITDSLNLPTISQREVTQADNTLFQRSQQVLSNMQSHLILRRDEPKISIKETTKQPRSERTFPITQTYTTLYSSTSSSTPTKMYKETVSDLRVIPDAQAAEPDEETLIPLDKEIAEDLLKCIKKTKEKLLGKKSRESLSLINKLIESFSDLSSINFSAIKEFNEEIKKANTKQPLFNPIMSKFDTILEDFHATKQQDSARSLRI